VLETNKEFQVKKRALHVISEATRVFRFQAVCESTTLTNENKIEVLAVWGVTL
jgi:hypothetical protein